ncbi:sigma-70 family RNA polymerase sigma factor, partial [Streptomyces sp. S6]
MDEQDRLAERFEAQRGPLRAVAYRMLGSLGEAEDAVQETWLRLCRTDVSDVGNLAGWLRTVCSRVCLDLLRSRAARREEPVGQRVPDRAGGEAGGPEDEALLAESVGRALLVVLDRLAPAERVAFVLHDAFAVPFDEIAPIVERSPVTAKKLASRARHKVRGTPVVPPADLARQRHVVGAFLAASRGGDLEALL